MGKSDWNSSRILMPSAFQTEKVENVTIFNFFARNNQMASEF